MPRLIVVSNRVAAPKPRGAASLGGLTMALTDALKGTPGIWFGWSGRTGPSANRPDIQATNGVNTATVDLPPEDVADYYNGFANTVLWPLFHHRIDLAHFERTFGDGYLRVNERFAEALCDLVRPDDLIWVHDYHLIPLGSALRRRGLLNRIGFFLHTPWPAPEILVTLPRHEDLVRSLFAYDLIGFQCQAWLKAFKDYVLEEASGRAGTGGRVTAFGEDTIAGVFPIGIDPSAFASLVRSAEAERSFTRAAATGIFRSMIVSVDRVDYAKGLETRFLTIERLFQRRPDLAEKVFLLQVAQPSRQEVRAYADINRRLDALSGRINGRFGSVDWSPIRYLNHSYDRDQIAGLYRAARVGLVTPLMDGMNLVAKEFVAAQDPEDPGVLILSRFTGAAEQMGAALIVNPYSLEDVAEAVVKALDMSRDERIDRWRSLMAKVVGASAADWRSNFLEALKKTPARLDLVCHATPMPVDPASEGQPSRSRKKSADGASLTRALV